MIVSKSRVNHAEYGNGIVESIDPYSSVCTVDFKGVLKRLKYTNLQNGHINEYKPETSFIKAIEELEKELSRNHVAISTLGMLRKKLGL
jgi:hypothetical protein